MSKSKRPDELLPTRKSLLSRLKNWEDSRSWQEFFDTYWNLIYGVAVKSGLSDAEAQDVVQETVISASKHMKDFKYDPSKSFKAWLLNAARWRITDQFRKRLPVQTGSRPKGAESTRTKTIDRIPSPTGYDLEAKWNTEWREHIQEAALRRIRSRVNPKHYQIFDAYTVKGWPVAKVMATLSVSEDQVYKVKSRITRALKEEVIRLENGGL